MKLGQDYAGGTDTPYPWGSLDSMYYSTYGDSMYVWCGRVGPSAQCVKTCNKPKSNKNPVHTYIAYRVSTSVVYIVVVYYACWISTVTCVCVTHTNSLTRYPIEGVCTLTM